MEYTNLGKTGLRVSRLCLGCMGFGDPAKGQHSWTLDEAQARPILRQALDLGINFFDTALAYQGGSSEQYLGRALKDYARREDVVVATKFLPRTQAERDTATPGQQHVERMLDRSLLNLGMDYVDLFIYHMWDYQTPLYEILEGLNRVVRAGKARYTGISNCFAYQLVQANALAKAEGFPQFVSVQSHYNLIYREIERELLPLCREEGIALTPYSPLAGGRLARPGGVHTQRLTADSYAKFKYDGAEGLDRPVLARVEELARRRGVTMAQLSLAWLLHQGTVPVVGATKLSQLTDAVNAAGLSLTPEEQSYLEAPYLPHKLSGVMAQNTPPQKYEGGYPHHDTAHH